MDLEALNLFEKTTIEFLTSMGGVLPGSKAKFTGISQDLEKGVLRITSLAENYNTSFAKYENRLINKDWTLLSRVNNVIFARTKLSKLAGKLSAPDLEKMWSFLKVLYLYSELYCHPDRTDLGKLIDICKIEETENGEGEEIVDLETLRSQMDEAISMITEMFPGNNKLSDLLKSVGSDLEEQIRENGGKLNTRDIMKNFTGMLQGKAVGKKIGGIDLGKILAKLSSDTSASETITPQVQQDILKKFMALSTKKMFLG